MTSHTHLQYETDVGGKSGLTLTSTSFAVGPSSDQVYRGLSACPLNRWKVVIPIPGFTSTSWTSTGRTTTESNCAIIASGNKIQKRTTQKHLAAAQNFSEYLGP